MDRRLFKFRAKFCPQMKHVALTCCRNCVSVDNGIEVNNAPEGRIVMVVIHAYYFFFLHSFSRQEILHRTVSALLRAPILS